MNVTHTSWPERYRPDDLDGTALAPDLRRRFERYLAGDVLPRHLILSGPPGFGKTTVVTIIAERLYSPGQAPRVMRVKAAETGNVEFVRTRVINFMRAGFGGSKLLIFEEASGLTPESQEALRVPLEEWSDLCRVIFVTNALDKVDGAVRSRCDEILMERPPIDECARVLGDVLKQEGVSVEPANVQAFARGYFAAASDGDRRDLRSMLASAQHHIQTAGVLPAPPEAEPSSALTLEEWRSEHRVGEATDGAKLLNDLAAAFAKYLSLPKGGQEALALWTVFAWAHEAFSVSPILTLASPTMRAGKSTAFELLEQLLIPGATYHPSSMTPAVVYRLKGLAEAGQDAPPAVFAPPTLCLLMDEADNWLNVDQNLRAVLNSGWKRRGAKVPRMVGPEPGWFSTWYPKALALIDRADAPLPQTLRDRSIVVPMQRKSKDETLTPFPGHQNRVPELEALCKASLHWVADNFATLRDLGGGVILADGGLNDRARNNWHPLMAIAHVASGDWEKRARWASLTLVDTTREVELLIELLADVKAVFDQEQVDQLRSVALVEKLVALEARPWQERRLTAIKFATMLRPLHIKSTQLWTAMGLGAKANRTGYERGQFEEAWRKYLD